MRLSTSLPYTDFPEAIRALLDDFRHIDLDNDPDQINLILAEISSRDIGDESDDLVCVMQEVERGLRRLH